MKGLPFLLVILIMPFTGATQYFQYSQYEFTDQRINPAMVASSDYASVSFIFRNQSTGAPDINLKSNMISGAYPFLSARNGRRWSGVGLSLMDDRSGGIFSMQEISVSYAINVSLNRFQSLSLGFKGLYQQRSVHLDGLFTGSQFVRDRGFDESLYNGENLGLLRSDFATFSSGIYWQQIDRAGIRLAYWGISLFDLNKPDHSFSGVEDQLNSTFVASGGIRIYKNGNMSFMPEFLLTHSAARRVMNLGGVTSYEIKPHPNQVAARIDLITKYVPGRSGILGLQFHRDHFSVGFSYDFPVLKKNEGNLGAFEVALQIKSLVDPGLKRRISKRKTPAKRSQATEKKPAVVSDRETEDIKAGPENDSTRNENAVKSDLSTSLRHKQDSVLANATAGRVSHQPLVIEKTILHFNFEFNSTNLDETSTKYLDDLSTALAENTHMKISLTGHTDNVGSPAFNMRLSLFRANVIRKYLVERGVDVSRIQTDGKGLHEPLNENKTEAERAANRRVELVIYYEE